MRNNFYVEGLMTIYDIYFLELFKILELVHIVVGAFIIHKWNFEKKNS